MTPRHAREQARSGITLTEILISILIMGVGLVSLATLFPLGLVRLREAQRQNRSGLMAESVFGDMGSKNLLSKTTFAESYYGYFDPFLVDFDSVNGSVTLAAFGTINPNTGASFLPVALSAASPQVTPTSSISPRGTGGGLPVCYDPLWRSITGVLPPIMAGSQVANAGTPPPTGYYTAYREARFGAGVIAGNSFLRADPGGGQPSAHGLQRITNFLPWYPGIINWPYTYPVAGTAYPATLRDLVSETFISPDDIVMQNSEPNQAILDVTNPGTVNQGAASGVVPQFFPITAANGNASFESRSDWRYSWLFTGSQVDTQNGAQFDGDVVIMENRPFAFEQIVSPVTGNASFAPAGETVVEAVFGYNRPAVSPGYGVAADRTVLLRWPGSMVDPEVKVGSWICDVTYERVQSVSDSRYGNAVGAGVAHYPFQRCHWYQVARKGEVEDEVNGPSPGYRRTVLHVNSNLKSRTLVNANGDAINLNAALIMPSVVNVYRQVFYIR